MSAEGAGSAAASDDLDRCLELAASDPRRRRAVQHADRAVGLLPVVRRARPRARDLGRRCAARWPENERSSRPQNRAGFGDARLVRRRLRRPPPTQLDRRPRRLASSGADEAVAAAWFVPNDPTVAMFAHLGLARFMTGDVDGAEESLAHARARRRGARLPARAVERGLRDAGSARGCGSRPGRRARRARTLAEVVDAARGHGFEGWAVIATTQSVALDGRLRDLRAGAAPATLAEHAETLALNLDGLGGARAAVFLPFYMTTAGALLAARRRPRRGARALRAVARARRRDGHALLRRRDAAPASPQLESDPRPGAARGARARALAGRAAVRAADRARADERERRDAA